MKSSQQLREKIAVYFVVGSQDCDNSVEKTVSIVSEALAGGVGTIQLRDKGSTLSADERYQLANELLTLCRKTGALFFVNDDVELAIRIQADGIHVGQEDMGLDEVRRMVGPSLLIGVSAGTVEEALVAKAGGVDYLGVGAMYATASKADAGDPIGPVGLAKIRNAIGNNLPIVGIGGINSKNVIPVMRAGADGVAVISAISKAISPREAAIQLAQLVCDHSA